MILAAYALAQVGVLTSIRNTVLQAAESPQPRGFST
jgi:hypothetical protein